MAKVIGKSGSFEMLKRKFQLSGIWDFITLGPIKILKEDPSQFSSEIKYNS